MRFGLMIAAAAIFLLVIGGQGIYEAVESGSQKTIAYETFLRMRPGIGWYKINGANWTIIDGIYRQEKESKKIDSKIFIPLHDASLSPDQRDKEKVVIVLQTERPDIHATAEQLASASGDDQILNVMKSNPGTAFYSGPIEGTVQFGMDADSETREQLAKLNDTNLDPNYVIIKDGARPNGWIGIGEFLGGLVVGACAVFYFISRYGNRG